MQKNNFYDDNPELNITPLVDVMLVLLVVLMLIIPALRYDELINLPTGSKEHSSAAKPKDLLITITKNHIIFEHKSFEYSEFFDNFALMSSRLDKNAAVYIAGDKNINYDILMQVLAALKKIGFSKIALQSK